MRSGLHRGPDGAIPYRTRSARRVIVQIPFCSKNVGVIGLRDLQSLQVCPSASRVVDRRARRNVGAGEVMMFEHPALQQQTGPRPPFQLA